MLIGTEWGESGEPLGRGAVLVELAFLGLGGGPQGLLDRWVRHRDEVPRLEIGAAGRARRGAQARFDEDARHRPIAELTHGAAACQLVGDRLGVSEYLVWRTEDEAIDWWALEEDEYRPLPVDAAGSLRSRVFPGLSGWTLRPWSPETARH